MGDTILGMLSLRPQCTKFRINGNSIFHSDSSLGIIEHSRIILGKKFKCTYLRVS